MNHTHNYNPSPTGVVASATTKPRVSQRCRAFSFASPFVYLFLCLYLVIVVFPLFWLFYSSLKSDQDIFLKPFAIVYLVILGMKAFDVIWLLTNQQPQTDSHVITTRMVQTMFNEFRVGEATALAVLLFLMVLIGSAATMRGLKRDAVEM